ncbi:GGDEF domain-containing protein [Patescibacteria group bacterium]|nr:GGDEF domain-containing protein [Patescibacteria group bacterium]
MKDLSQREALATIEQLKSQLAESSLKIAKLEERIAELNGTAEELSEDNLRLRNLVVTDELTGLGNRRAFDAELNKAVYRLGRYDSPFGLVLFDVVNFKRINDEFSYTDGDLVIKAVGELIKQVCREADSVQRFGGDEFAVILSECRPEGPDAVVERIKTILASHPIRISKNRKVEVELRYAPLYNNVPGVTAEQLFNQADSIHRLLKAANGR